MFRGQWIPQAVPAAMELASATGDLGGTLATLSRMYEQQAEFRLRTAPGVLTPVLMLVVGSGVTLCISATFSAHHQIDPVSQRRGLRRGLRRFFLAGKR